MILIYKILLNFQNNFQNNLLNLLNFQNNLLNLFLIALLKHFKKQLTQLQYESYNIICYGNPKAFHQKVSSDTGKSSS